MDFNYAIDPYSKNPILLLNKHIGYDWLLGPGIDGKEFARELFEIDRLGTAQKISIFVNSPGGSIWDAYDILNAINQVKTYVDALICGFAYSSAGWCIMTANKVGIADYGSWMGHNPYNADNPDEESDALVIAKNSIATIISERSGKNGVPKKSVEDVRGMMQRETFYTPREMYDNGMCDEVVPTGTITNIINRYPSLQNINKVKTIGMNTSKITNRLNLAEGSTEDAIVGKIADMENSLKTAELKISNLTDSERIATSNKERAATDLQNAQTKLADTQLRLTDVENKYVEATNKLAALEATNSELVAANFQLRNEKETAAEAAREAKEAEIKKNAEDMVDGYVNANVIKADAKDEWVDQAISNYNQAKLFLDTLAGDRVVKAPKPTNVTPGEKRKVNSVLEAYESAGKEELKNRSANWLTQVK